MGLPPLKIFYDYTIYRSDLQVLICEFYTSIQYILRYYMIKSTQIQAKKFHFQL